jgi:hypothetical protein
MSEVPAGGFREEEDAEDHQHRPDETNADWDPP